MNEWESLQKDEKKVSTDERRESSSDERTGVSNA